eukprot:COSAG02_NODE_67695_length_252_cov_0.679739_2_plen_36_part_01
MGFVHMREDLTKEENQELVMQWHDLLLTGTSFCVPA